MAEPIFRGVENHAGANFGLHPSRPNSRWIPHVSGGVISWIDSNAAVGDRKARISLVF
jgi:hypothetical protein